MRCFLSLRLLVRVHISAFSLSYFLLTSVTLCGQTHFAISGSANNQSWDQTGKLIQSIDYTFQVTSFDRARAVRLEDLNVKTGQRESYDYVENVFDGKDLYRVVHYPAWNVKKSPAVHKYSTYGAVRPNNFPSNATPTEKVIWLAFCMGDSWLPSATNFPSITLAMQPNNVSKIEFAISDTPPHVPTLLKVWVKDLLFNGIQHSGVHSLALSPPLDKGFLQMELNTQWDNAAKLVPALPTNVTVSFYGVDVSSTPPSTFLTTRTTISIARISTPTSAPHPPSLAEQSNVVDYRYTNKQGLPFHYLESSSSWVSRNNLTPIKTLEGKPKAPKYPKPTIPKPLIGKQWNWVLVVVFMAPLLFILYDFLRRRGRK